MVLIVRLLQRGNATGQAAGGGGRTAPADQERVCMFQQVPWFLQLWLHTLRIAVDGQVRAVP